MKHLAKGALSKDTVQFIASRSVRQQLICPTMEAVILLFEREGGGLSEKGVS